MLLMKSIAQDVAPLGIRVNSICPGTIKTPINTEAGDTPKAYSNLMYLIPYKRMGEPADAAHAAVWPASDQTDHVSGASLMVEVDPLHRACPRRMKSREVLA